MVVLRNSPVLLLVNVFSLECTLNYGAVRPRAAQMFNPTIHIV